MQTTITPEQIRDLQEQLELLKLACDRLSKSTPPNSTWILIESQYCQTFPCTAPDGGYHEISLNEWHCFPNSWREHLLGLKKANDRNHDFAQYTVQIWPQ
jgi:hypothetical protein